MQEELLETDRGNTLVITQQKRDYVQMSSDTATSCYPLLSF